MENSLNEFIDLRCIKDKERLEDLLNDSLEIHSWTKEETEELINEIINCL